MFDFQSVEQQQAIINSEQIVLGILLNDGDRKLLRSSDLKPDHFTLKEHKELFKVIQEADKRGEKFDTASIYADLLEKGELDFIGGFDGLTKLVNSITTLTDFEVHETRVLKNFQRNQALNLLGKFKENSLSLDELITNLNSLNTIITNELPSLNNAIDRTITSMIENKQGIKTRYTDYDRITKGLHPGELVIIGARPSMGKSAFVANLINNITKSDTNPEGCVSGLFTLEMDDTEVLKRLSSMNGGVPLVKFREASESFDMDEWKKTNLAFQYLRGFDLVVFDEAAPTITNIRRSSEALRNHYGKDRQLVIVIDYLQLIQSNNNSSNGNTRNQEVSEISRALKIMARELNCTVVALVQLNRGVESRDDKRPIMKDIRDSGSIEQDADQIGFLYRDDYYNKDSDKGNIIELNITKHRNGPLGSVELYFEKEITKIHNLSKQTEG